MCCIVVMAERHDAARNALAADSSGADDRCDKHRRSRRLTCVCSRAKLQETLRASQLLTGERRKKLDEGERCRRERKDDWRREKERVPRHSREQNAKLLLSSV